MNEVLNSRISEEVLLWTGGLRAVKVPHLHFCPFPSLGARTVPPSCLCEATDKSNLGPCIELLGEVRVNVFKHIAV